DIRTETGAPQIDALAGMRRTGVELANLALVRRALEDQLAVESGLRLAFSVAGCRDNAGLARHDTPPERRPSVRARLPPEIIGADCGIGGEHGGELIHAAHVVRVDHQRRYDGSAGHRGHGYLHVV